MKQLYSTIMMLAMMVAALSLTACGGDDDSDDGVNNSSTTFTIAIDGNKKEMSQETWDLLGTWEGTALLIGTNISYYRTLEAQARFGLALLFQSLSDGFS